MKRKELSRELQRKIKIANRQITIANRETGKAIDFTMDVYNQALKDGWTPLEAGDICRRKLTKYNPKTLREILPPEAKHLEMVRKQEKKSLPYKPIAGEDPQSSAAATATTSDNVSDNLTLNQSSSTMLEDQRRQMDEVASRKFPEVKVQTPPQQEDNDQKAKQRQVYIDRHRRELNEEERELLKQEIGRIKQIINKINWDVKQLPNQFRVIDFSKFTEEEYKIILHEAISKLIDASRKVEDYKRYFKDSSKQLEEVSKRFKM